MKKGKSFFVNDIIMKTINPNGIKTTHATSTILKVKEHILVYKKKNTNLRRDIMKVLLVNVISNK